SALSTYAESLKRHQHSYFTHHFSEVTMTNLTAWRKIAEPHRDIREERFDPAVFAADLGMVLQGKGPINRRW
ncbi:MAG: hypothetical protein ACE5H0_14170, partial [Bacteroidota bacterium]